MRPAKQLQKWLNSHATEASYCLFTPSNLRALFPAMSDVAFKALLSRSVSSGLLHRVSRGVYLFKKTVAADGLLLFRAATLLRPNALNYLSLETVLSDSGVISQVPLNWISVMTSGRSAVISCGNYGSIEFVHTNQKPEILCEELSYDAHCGMWRASVKQALRDMRMARRNMDLIDWDIANEFI